MAFPPNFTGVDGSTLIDLAYLNAYDTEMSSALVDTTSGGGAGSSQTPAATTAEVRDARDGEASLLAKLNAMEADFTGATTDQLAQQHLQNIAINGCWLCWPNGDAAAPAGWALSGAGAAVARDTGTTPPLATGAWNMRITPGAGAVAALTQETAPAALASRLAGLGLFKGSDNAFTNVVAVGLCKTANAAEAGLYITIGGVITDIGTPHLGGGDWEIVYAQAPLSSSLTSISWGARVVAAGAAAQFGPLCLYLTRGTVPRIFIPEGWVEDEFTFQVAAAAANGVDKWRWLPRTMGVITNVQLHTPTATGADWILDVNTRDAATAQTSMYAAGTRPRILNGATSGGAAPDSTYARKCFKPFFGATAAEGGIVSFDLDSGGGHADVVYVTVGYIRPTPAWRAFYDYNSP